MHQKLKTRRVVNVIALKSSRLTATKVPGRKQHSNSGDGFHGHAILRCFLCKGSGVMGDLYADLLVSLSRQRKDSLHKNVRFMLP